MADNTNALENNDLIPHMNTLAQCLNRAVLDGYEDDFKVLEDEKLTSLKTEKKYSPEEVHVINYFRFEGQSDPNDNTILYLIETDDGLKGTLVDAFGAYSDERVSDFFKKVEDIYKKTGKAESPSKHH